MILICIDNRGIEDIFTLDKQYTTVDDCYEKYYHLFNDKGNPLLILGDNVRFLTIDEYREKQLNKILQ